LAEPSVSALGRVIYVWRKESESDRGSKINAQRNPSENERTKSGAEESANNLQRKQNDSEIKYDREQKRHDSMLSDP
jgi:hypothetical protein